MSRVRVALARLRELFRRRPRAAAERDEEFAFHLAMEAAENVRRGMSDAEARRVALLRFGGTQRFREETSDARGVAALDHIARDTRFALRRLVRAPAFAAGVVATLGIGIGVAAGIGTIVYGVLLRDLPYHDSDRLVRVGFHTDGLPSPGDLNSPATFFHFDKSARSFTELGSYTTNDSFILTDGDGPERVMVALMTPSVFTLLGVRPVLGQLFQPGDTSWSERADHRLLPVLISEDLWRRRYGADSAIIGRRVDVNRGERRVIGVLPRTFDFPSPSVSVYYPAPTPVRKPDIALRYLTVIGRLRVGVDAPAAESELNTLVPSLPARFPAITREQLRRSHARAVVTPLKAAIVAPVRPQLLILLMLVGVVLLVATTNVANLFLLRTERASREIAIALSLGASRLALARRFVIEGVVLGLASAVVALPVTALAVSTKFGFTDREIPRLHEVTFTSAAMAAIVAGTMLIGGLVGLTAMSRAGLEGLFDRLGASRSTAGRGWRRMQNGLVAFQVAVALMLLVAAGLLGRSFWNLRNAKIGFDPANAMTFEVSLPWDGYTSYGAMAAFHARAADRLSALPGVTSVGVAQAIPLGSRGGPTLDMQLQADDGQQRAEVAAAGNLANADYFRTMGIPLRTGRSFRSGDLRGTPAVLVSERLARDLFGTTRVVGRTITRSSAGAPPSRFTIVGVVGDVPWGRIEDGPVPMVYFPLLRDGDGLAPESHAVPYRAEDVQYVVRGAPLPSAATIQGIIKELDPRVPAANIRTLGALVDDATARVRLTMLLIAVAGAASLLLGVIGVYSVVSYAANGRLREFGIRLALGAEPARVGGMVLGEGLRLVAIGAAAGLAAALGTTRFLRALLYEVGPTSVAEFAAATALLLAVTLFATLVPARRAARTHPAVVLRGE